MKTQSPYELFGYKKRLITDIPYGEDYKCPNCKKYMPEGPYVNDGEEYPIYCNETLFETMDGTTHDWDEIHKCPHCGTLFYYRNGCF